jgi:hypothetical protein
MTRERRPLFLVCGEGIPLETLEKWFYQARFEGFSGRKNFLSANENVFQRSQSALNNRYKGD